MLSHNSLVNYYKTIFSLVQNHKWNLTELENMMPWEREVYVDMLITYIKDENDKQRQKEAEGKYG